MIMASSSAAAEFIKRCFEARTATHQLHLMTDSFAQHKALDDFYSSITGLADELAEAFQGQYGVIRAYPNITPRPFSSGATYLRDFVKYIKANRMAVAEDSHLQNIIDEIVQLTYSTIYKLENLK
jgi:DNA-binding ferritin-like protein